MGGVEYMSSLKQTLVIDRALNDVIGITLCTKSEIPETESGIPESATFVVPCGIATQPRIVLSRIGVEVGSRPEDGMRKGECQGLTEE